jgi:hypothetical protein
MRHPLKVSSERAGEEFLCGNGTLRIKNTHFPREQLEALKNYKWLIKRPKWS